MRNIVFFCIPCLVLLLYFGILAVFFPRYRTYLKDAWRCFYDKLRGKKCPVSFDNKMRLALSTWFAEHKMESLGRFFYKEKNFKTVLTITWVVFTIISIYLFIVFIQYLYTPPCTNGVCGVVA